MCVIDDAQWLDAISAQTLAFVARRQLADPVALVFAIRGEHEDSELTGQPTLDVRGLGDADAHALLESVLTGDVDHRVRETIVAETRGNPLALLELPRGLSTAELSFGFGLADAVPLETHLEQGFAQRLAALPGPTRLFLLAAALEPVGDLSLLGRAMQRLDVDLAASAPAVRAGLIELSARVRFRHPLVRSAVARAAEVTDLRAVHLALAEETDPELDPDRRAWHLAHAASGPDEEVAVELERCADRARARGGLAAQAAFPRTCHRIDPRPRSTSCPHPGCREGLAPFRLVGRGTGASGGHRDCAARRADARQGGGSPGPDSVLLQPWPRRAAPAAVSSAADGSVGRNCRPRHLPRCVGGGVDGRTSGRRCRRPRCRPGGPRGTSVDRSSSRSVAGRDGVADDRWVCGRRPTSAVCTERLANRRGVGRRCASLAVARHACRP